MNRRLSIVFLLMGTVLLPLRARAHGDSVSALNVRLERTVTRASLQLNFRDLVQWVPPQSGSGDYPAAVVEAMRRAQANLISLRLEDQAIEPMVTVVLLPSAGVVRVEFTYPPAGAATTLAVRTLHVDRLPTGHHQVLSIEDARRGGEGMLIAQETLGMDQEEIAIDLPPPSQQPGRLRLVATQSPQPRAGGPSDPPRSSRRFALIALLSLPAVIALLIAIRRTSSSSQRTS
jgi:hypothetical protein